MLDERKSKGVTLTALVITIIILLILAGVVLAILTGENGIFKKASQAEENTKRAQAQEKVQLAINQLQITKLGKAVLLDVNDFKDSASRDYHPEIKLLQDIQEGDTSAKVEVDGYEFTIDLNLRIKSGPNTGGSSGGNSNGPNEIGEFELQIQTVNGTYVTILAEAESSNSNIVAYQYYVNGEYREIKLGDVLTLDITGLELDTNYEIYVVAIDDKANTKFSKKIQVTTLDKLYLYKEGDECIPVTDGWAYTGYDSYSGSLTKYDNYMSLIPGKYPSRVYCGTKKEIELNNYATINARTSIGDQSTPGETGTGVNLIASRTGYFNKTPYHGGFQIPNYVGPAYIHFNWTNQVVDIYEVWLEK